MAILAADAVPFLTSSTVSGVPQQFATFTNATPMQGFPTSESSYAVISSGSATEAPGQASTFVGTDMGGVFISGGSPDGIDAHDVATLKLGLQVPMNANALSFDWRFGTEENPTFLGGCFQDFFTAFVTEPSGSNSNLALLQPGDLSVTVDNAAGFSNPVTGESGAPEPPLPSPDDTVYNAVLLELEQTQYDVSGMRGETIVLEFTVGDACDGAYDTAVFLDNLSFNVPLGPSISDVDVVQVFVDEIDDPTHVVGLIAGKPTTLRIVTTEVTTPVEVQASITFSPFLLPITTMPTTLSPGCTPLAQTLQIGGCDALNIHFNVPESRDQTITVELRRTDTGTLLGPAFTLAETFQAADPLVIVPVSVCHDLLGLVCGSPEDIGVIIPYLEVIYPASAITVVRLPVAPIHQWLSIPHLDLLWWPVVLTKLQLTRLQWILLDKLFPIQGLPPGTELSSVYWHGVVHESLDSNILGLALFERTAAGTMDLVTPDLDSQTILGGETIAHELGHSLGRKHVPADKHPPAGCAVPAGPDENWPYLDATIQIGGFNPNTQKVLLSGNLFDIMSYCDGQWVSPYTYKGLAQSLNVGPPLGTPSGPVSQQTAQPQASSTDFWLVSGSIATSGPAVFDPLFTFEGQAPATSTATSTESGTHRLELRDATSIALLARYFVPAQPSNLEVTDVFFAEVLPVTMGTASIVLLEGVVELGSLSLAGVPPLVNIVSPAGGETLNATHTVQWLATDSDSSALSFRVDFSSDNGASWLPISSDVTSTEVTIDFGALPGAGQARIRVRGSDGVNTGEGISNAFTVAGKVPQVSIVRPTSQQVFGANNPVFLDGLAYDADDGSLTDTSLQWTSSLDGALGAGSSLTMLEPSEGDHFIILEATDSDGNTTTASALIVVDVTPPGITTTLSGDVGQGNCFTSDITADVTAQDSVSGTGLDSVEFSIDGGQSWSLLTQILTFPGDGVTNLLVRASDNAANTTVISSIFTKDSVSPHLISNSTTTGPLGSPGIILRINDSSPGSGLVSIQVKGSNTLVDGVTLLPTTFIELFSEKLPNTTFTYEFVAEPIYLGDPAVISLLVQDHCNHTNLNNVSVWVGAEAFPSIPLIGLIVLALFLAAARLFVLQKETRTQKR